MGMFKVDGSAYLTANDIIKELGLGKSTVYARFGYKSSPERWGVEVRKDPSDGELKYCVSRDNFEKLWVGSQPDDSLSDNKSRILKLQSK